MRKQEVGCQRRDWKGETESAEAGRGEKPWIQIYSRLMPFPAKGAQSGVVVSDLALQKNRNSQRKAGAGGAGMT